MTPAELPPFIEQLLEAQYDINKGKRQRLLEISSTLTNVFKTIQAPQ
jgi:hypothetical protein